MSGQAIRATTLYKRSGQRSDTRGRDRQKWVRFNGSRDCWIASLGDFSHPNQAQVASYIQRQLTLMNISKTGEFSVQFEAPYRKRACRYGPLHIAAYEDSVDKASQSRCN